MDPYNRVNYPVKTQLKTSPCLDTTYPKQHQAYGTTKQYQSNSV